MLVSWLMVTLIADLFYCFIASCKTGQCCMSHLHSVITCITLPLYLCISFLPFKGYQIPKGWNVIYSIADTHDVAEIFPNKEEFNPDRFLTPFPEDSSRFSFIPFGGGVRSCVGKEFAKILLKTFIVELCRNCDWDLLNGPPTMKTGPIVYPVDNLPTQFKPYKGTI